MSARCEIGGYFELEHFFGEVYHEDAIALNSGRACLEYLLELRRIKRLWLPDFLCDSLHSACMKHNVDVCFYSINENLRPVFDFEMATGDFLYLVDYYGQIEKCDIKTAADHCEGRLIVDEAQGFFRDGWPGADTIYSCRKFFGVADGAYLYTKDCVQLERRLQTDESHDRMGFVLGRFERSASEFYQESKTNNMRFDNEPVKLMSTLTENILRAVYYEEVARRRDKNF